MRNSLPFVPNPPNPSGGFWSTRLGHMVTHSFDRGHGVPKLIVPTWTIWLDQGRSNSCVFRRRKGPNMTKWSMNHSPEVGWGQVIRSLERQAEDLIRALWKHLDQGKQYIQEVGLQNLLFLYLRLYFWAFSCLSKLFWKLILIRYHLNTDWAPTPSPGLRSDLYLLWPLHFPSGSRLMNVTSPMWVVFCLRVSWPFFLPTCFSDWPPHSAGSSPAPSLSSNPPHPSPIYL